MVTLYYVYKTEEEYEKTFLFSTDENGKEFLPVFSADPRRVTDISKMKFIKEDSDLQIGLIQSKRDLKELIEILKTSIPIGNPMVYKKPRIKIDEEPYLKRDAIYIDISSVKLFEKNMKEIEKSIKRCNKIIDFNLKNVNYLEDNCEVISFVADIIWEITIFFRKNKGNNEKKYSYEIVLRATNEYFEEVIDRGFCNETKYFKETFKEKPYKYLDVVIRFVLKKILANEEERNYYKNMLIEYSNFEEEYLENFQNKYSKFADVNIRQIFETESEDIKELYEVSIPNLGTIIYRCKEINNKKTIEVVFVAKDEETSKLIEIEVETNHLDDFDEEIDYIYENLEEKIEFIKYLLAIYQGKGNDLKFVKKILLDYYNVGDDDIPNIIKKVNDQIESDEEI